MRADCHSRWHSLYLRRRHKHPSANIPRFHGHESPNTNPITLDGGGFAAIWIPAAPIDVAVFNSSGTQQYKVLNVTALPLVVTSLTANFFQSATTNPALSGFLRMGSPDQICWRNNGNSADVCLSKNASDTLFFNGNQFAYIKSDRMFGRLARILRFLLELRHLELCLPDSCGYRSADLFISRFQRISLHLNILYADQFLAQRSCNHRQRQLEQGRRWFLLLPLPRVGDLEQSRTMKVMVQP